MMQIYQSPLGEQVESSWQQISRSGQRSGVEQKVAIMFADINNYTPFAEALPAHDVFNVLKWYYSVMGRLIKTHQGQIFDYYGDGFMACFGLHDSRQAVVQAIQAGLHMFEAVGHMNDCLHASYGKAFQIRVGINYGQIMLGWVGIQDMQKLAAIGDEVNFASRIENANKDLGTRLLISEAAYLEAEAAALVKQVFEVSIKGKSGLYKLYEIAGLT